MTDTPLRWRSAVVAAGLLTLIDLALVYYWFGIADRYAVFLYNHLGQGPFDPQTRTRYWMTGFVAGGILALLSIGGHWLVRQVDAGFAPAPWWQTWLLAMPVMGVGVVAITMTVNQPALPLGLALSTAAAHLLGLALALLAGEIAARAPLRLAFLTLDGAGLMPPLLALWTLELPGRGLAMVPDVPVMLALVTAVQLAGVAWLAGVTAVRVWFHLTDWDDAAHIVAAGIALSYLMMPLLHYVTATPPGYKYITVAQNFMAHTPGWQLASLALAAFFAWGVTAVRLRLPTHLPTHA